MADYRQPVDYEELLADVNLSRLQEVFRFMMKRQEDKIDPVRSTFGKIEKDEVDMDRKALYVEEYIKSHARFRFQSLLEKQHSKMEIIVTFLVILEMMKLGRIDIEQQEIGDDIVIISHAG